MSDDPKTPSELRIEELGFSARVRNSLRREGVHTLEDLTQMTQEKLRDIRNFGAACEAEVTAKLDEYNLALSITPIIPFRSTENAIAAEEAMIDLIARVGRLEQRLEYKPAKKKRKVKK